MSDDPQNKNRVTKVSDYKARKQFRRLLNEYAESLPQPSHRYGNLIFLYSEGLAISGRELLFDQLNRRASQFGQTLIITDVGFGRAGFYVNFDEIGSAHDDPDYEALIDNWNTHL